PFALRKYRVEPSGENAGSLTLQPSGVIRRGGARSRVSRWRAYRAVVPFRSASTLRWANTTTWPSGESSGEDTRSRRTRSRTSKPRASAAAGRSEERRVGKECRSRWSREHEKKMEKSGSHCVKHSRQFNTASDKALADLQADGSFAKISNKWFDRFFFSSRRRHTRFSRDWSSDVCSSDLTTWPSGESSGEDTRSRRTRSRTSKPRASAAAG